MKPSADIAAAVMRGAFGANRGRTAIATLAIALGVALGFAIQTVNRTAIAEFSSGIATISGAADLVVRGPTDGFDESVYPAIARLDAVAVASPEVEVDARLPGRDEPLRVIGVDAFRAAGVTPAFVGRGSDALDLLRPDRIHLSSAAHAWLGPGDVKEVTIQAGDRVVTFAVAGSVPASGNQRLGVVDIAAAQEAFGRLGRLSRIDVRLAPGADPDGAREAIAALLPAGTTVEPPARTADLAQRMTRAYRINLTVLSLIALFTGSLLVFSTQALSVVRRRTQLALLRTLGLSRSLLVRCLLVEGALIGTIGAGIGIAAGYALAAIFVDAFGTDLGAGYFRGEAPTLAVSLPDAVAFGLLGVAATLAGAWLPAREAASASPSAAIRAGDDARAFAQVGSPWPGLACLAAAAIVVALPPIGGLPVAGYAAIALILFGTLLLLPRFTRWLLMQVPRPRAPPAALALDSLRAAPGQAIVSLAAIVAAVSLAVSMAIMVASFRQSLAGWLDQVLPAELYVRAGSARDTGWLDPSEQRDLARLPGVRRVEFQRTARILLRGDDPPVTLLARDFDADADAERLPLVGDASRVKVGDSPPAWINESFADRYGAGPGARIALPLEGRERTFTVSGVWRDYARQTAAVVVRRDDYRRLTGDDRVGDAALWLEPGARVEAIRDAIETRFGADRLSLATAGEMRQISLSVFDRTFAVTYVLEAIAIVIGLVGLSASFGALALARRREFGVLRHLGMTRGGVAAMLGVEGFLASGAGLAIGLAVGAAISLILVRVVNRQSFGWSMDLHVPAGQLAVFCVALLATATLTALASARRATGGEPVLAVKDDW